ncbi:ElyC/SanA/YdcF family protein [Arcobacter arenosus]|uniref:ElyC/SanA/YdcF family protein n=1 Tax=Arcobacter arenosus TaxID=2576037 RepID=UPI003BAD5B27
MDATSKPSQSDLLVCLGGGDHMNRTRKSAELIESDLIKSNTIILTSFAKTLIDKENKIYDDKRKIFLEKLNYKDLNIIVEKDPKNTAEEIIYIKKYMIENGMKTVTIVSEPAHSRRILLFSSFLSVKGDENLVFNVVGSDDKSWTKYNYYQNKYALNYALTELSKIVYGIFAYGILDKIGLLEFFEETFKDEIRELKKEVYKNIRTVSL